MAEIGRLDDTKAGRGMRYKSVHALLVGVYQDSKQALLNEGICALGASGPLARAQEGRGGVCRTAPLWWGGW